MSDLPTGWIEAPLGVICEFNPKHPPDTDRDLDVTFVPMPAVNEYSGAIDAPDIRRLSTVWKGYTHFRDGDIIFAKITPCMENGKVAVAQGLINTLACGSTEFHVLRPADGINAEYLWRFLRQVRFRRDAEAQMTGAVGQRRVPKPYLEEYAIPLPPSAEQCRIVAKLDSLFSRTKMALDALDHIPVLIEHYKNAILERAFSGVLTAEWRVGKEETGEPKEIISKCSNQCIATRRSAQISRYLVKPGATPDYWVFARLEDICSEIVDGTHHTPTYVDCGVPFISVKDIHNDQIFFDDCKYITKDEHAELSRRCNPRKGDVLITKSGTIGRLAVVRDEPEFSLFVSVAMIRTASERISPVYIRYALENWIRSIDVASDITGSTIKNLHLQDIKALCVPVPSFKEQQEIVRRIEHAMTWLSIVEAECMKAKNQTANLDQRLLNKAFCGELVSQDQNDEPASVLLDRIRAATSEKPKPKRGRRRRAAGATA